MDLTVSALAEEQAKKKRAEEESGHDSAPSPLLSSPDTQQIRDLASTGDVVSMARPVVVKPMAPPKKEDASYLSECMRVRDELIQLKILLGATAKKESIMEQHVKTLRGTLSRKAYVELTATHDQDLRAIADALILNKSSPSFSKLRAVISEQTMKELGELESYKKVFPPLVSVTASDSVSLGELPAVDHIPSPRELVPRTAVSPKLSPLAALQQEIERMKKDAVALETAIKEGAAAVFVLQEQQRKKEEEVAALRERQPKLAEEIRVAEEERLPKLREEEAAHKRIEEERIRVEEERRKKAEAEVEAEDSGEEAGSEDEVETGMDQQAMLALFQQFMKAQALAKKKTAKKKVVASDHEAPPRHTGSTPPL